MMTSLLDRDKQTLWLNNRYRKNLLNGRRGGLNDLPLLKSLIYLLTENVFEGSHHGPKDKDNIALWQKDSDSCAQASAGEQLCGQRAIMSVKGFERFLAGGMPGHPTDSRVFRNFPSL